MENNYNFKNSNFSSSRAAGFHYSINNHFKNITDVVYEFFRCEEARDFCAEGLVLQAGSIEIIERLTERYGSESFPFHIFHVFSVLAIS